MAINIVEYDSNWERLAGAHFTMQHSFFNPHDFAITPNSYIFFQVRKGSVLLYLPSCFSARAGCGCIQTWSSSLAGQAACTVTGLSGSPFV